LYRDEDAGWRGEVMRPTGSQADRIALKQVSQQLGLRSKTLLRFARQYQNITRQGERDVNAAGFMEEIIRQRFEREAARATGEKKWEKRVVEPKDGHPILYDTGSLMLNAIRAVRGSFKAIKQMIRFKIPNAPHYARFHQDRTPKMVARPFADPPTDRELKPAWKFFRESVIRRVKALLGIGR